MLDHLEPKEDFTSNSNVIKDFKETLASQIVQRFELYSLHSAHPLLIGSLLDRHFKSITLSKFKDEGEIKKLKQALIELMETEQETESSITLTDLAIPATPKNKN